MIRIDDVYQTVLALANKEQRGYITPQEFNLFANQAQMEIFEQYFYDENQINKISGNQTEYSDMITLLNEKISIFKYGPKTLNYNGIDFSLPKNIYRLGTVFYSPTYSLLQSVELEEIEFNELLDHTHSPLVKPSLSRPVYIRRGESIVVYPQGIILGIQASWIRIPKKVQWGYFVLEDKALYDGNPEKTTNFELHLSDKTELIYKILRLAGVSIQKEDILNAGSAMEMAQIKQEKQ
jgi:hypothetical protein